MKKLMTVIAAVATGLAALTGGAVQDGNALGENVFDATKVDAETWTNGWSMADSADILTNSEDRAWVTNYNDSTQVLHIETGNTRLSRKVQDDGTKFTVSEKVYFDVQADLLGQVLDDVPLSTIPDDSKLALFLLDCSLVDGLPTTTNLCAIVRDPSDMTDTTAKALVMFGDGSSVTDLLRSNKARVSVQAYANVLLNDPSSMGFRVYVNGEDTKTGANPSYIAPLAVTGLYLIKDNALVKGETGICDNKVNENYVNLKSCLISTLQDSYNTVVLSLVNKEQTVQYFSLVGNANVSKVTINDTGLDFIQSDAAEAKVTLNGVEIVTDPADAYADGKLTKDCTITASIPAGSSMKVIKAAAADYLTSLGNNQWSYKFASGNDVTFTACAAAVTVEVTDGATTDYSTWAEVIEAMSSFSGTAKITLGDDLTSATSFSVGNDNVATIEIDLNGHTLTFNGNGNDGTEALGFGSSATVTIKDTSSPQTGRIVDAGAGDEHYAVYNGGKLTIEAGIFDGEVSNGEGATLSISGGSFRAAENGGDETFAFANTDETTYIVSGKKATLTEMTVDDAQVNYWVIEDDSTPAETKYIVSFIDEKNNTSNGVEVVSGQTTTALTPESVEGFKFLGWYEADAETAFDFTTAIEKNITLTAKWAQLVTLTVEADANVTSYKITDADSTEITLDENKKAQFVATDKKVVKATDIVYAEGYEADADNSTLSVTMDSDQTITIKSKATTPVVTTYTVTFSTTYGTAPDDQTVAENGFAKKPDVTLTADDYVFAYWYGEDENTEFDFENTAITSNITLTAKWNAKGWADYLGGDVDEAGYYVIDNEAEFKAFADHAQTLGTAGKKFALGADIALTVTDATAANTDGIGLQNFKDSLASQLETFKKKSFGGEFDGRGHTISNVILPCTDYAGLFMSTYGATIKNLKVSLGNATGFATPANSSVEYGGGVIAGVVMDTTIENCSTVVADSYNALQAPKGLAGIVGFAEGGTVLVGCTNNLNIVTSNQKAGGLVACSSIMLWDGSYGLTIQDCANFGNVTSSATVNTDKGVPAGIVPYVGTSENHVLTIKGTCVLNGTVTGTDGVACSIAYPYSGSKVVVEDGAVIMTTQTSQQPLYGATCDGLNFAVVEDGVATFVKNAAAQENGASTKVMVGGQTLTLSTVGDSITLDQSMATATVSMASTLSSDDYEIKETTVSDNVTTYTLAAIVKTWADYLGAAVNDVYEIDNLTELLAFQAQAKTLGTKDVSFALTADITLTDPWDGVGLYSDTSYAFEGTFDGRGHTISNLVFSNLSTGNKYRGFFGRVKDGVIKNLTIDGKGFVSGVTDEYGCAMFVGVMTTSAKSGETPVSAIENCVAKGSISATHNAAGFAVKVVAGTFKGCTNQVAITATSKKVGGIVSFAQANQDDGLSINVNFIDCANEGAVSVTGAGEGVGGILGYVTVIDLTIENCVNKAAITNSGTGTVGQIVGLANNNVKPTGTNKVLADTLTVGSYATGKSMDGASYASLPADDDNLVTLVKDSALALGNTYKVMVTGRSYTMSEVGSITFDQSLASVTVTKADSLSDDDGYSLTTVTNQDNSVTYTVAKAAAVDPIPAGTSKTDYADDDAAKKAAEAINADKANLITIPNADTLSLTDAQKTAYDALFVATANGTTVTVDFTEEATNTLAKAAEAIVESLDLQTFAASTGTEAQSLVTITDATPGLYYTLLSGTDTPANLPTATSVQAGNDGKVEFKLAKPGDKAFFKVVISAQEIHSTGLSE